MDLGFSEMIQKQVGALIALKYLRLGVFAIIDFKLNCRIKYLAESTTKTTLPLSPSPVLYG